jgi:hypothetical protein
MKLRFISRLLVLIMIGQVICQAQTPKSGKPTPNMKKAQSLVENLVKGDYAKVTKAFNAETKNRLPVSKVEEIWRAILAQAGAFKKQLSTESSQVRDKDQLYEVVVVKCQFERAALNVRVVFDTSDRVAGLFVANA